MAFKIKVPQGFAWARFHVVNYVFNKRLDVEYEIEVHEKQDYKIINYESSKVINLPDDFFLKEKNLWCKTRKKFNLRTKLFDFSSIYSIPAFDRNKVPSIYYKISHKYDIEIDIFGSIFFMLSSYEEYCSDSRDVHGRFSMFNSQLNDEFYQIPVVDYYIEILRYYLNLGTSHCNAKLKYRLTCDVDHPYSQKSVSISLKRFAKKMLMRNQRKIWTSKLLSMANSLKIKDPYIAGIHYLCSLCENSNVEGIFYFIPNRTSLRFDPKFKFKSFKVLELINTVIRYGCKLGIHPGYNTYNNSENFRTSVDEFETVKTQYQIGNELLSRQHYLRWDARFTPQIISEMKVTEDSTLGFADFVGFRNGTSHPFKIICLKEQSVSPVTEVPLIMMESSLLSSNAMGMNNYSSAKNYIDKIKSRVASVGGVLTVLWHNSDIYEDWHHDLLDHILAEL